MNNNAEPNTTRTPFTEEAVAFVRWLADNREVQAAAFSLTEANFAQFMANNDTRFMRAFMRTR